MLLKDIDALRRRIQRADSAARQLASDGFEQTHTREDGTTQVYSVNGIKSPEQLEDDLLALFVWIWSLKDHLKEAYRARQIDPQDVEAVVDQNPALQYVADVANRAKHGLLRKSRSGRFAQLTNVGFTIPQAAVGKMTFGPSSIGVDVAKPSEVKLHAAIQPQGMAPLDAFAVLSDALRSWEAHVLPRLTA